MLLRALCLIGFAVLSAGTAWAADVNVTVVDQSGAPVPDAVVYMLPTNGTLPPTTSATAIIDQIRRKFVPLVSVVQTGTTITFPNKDNFEHDVYSFSPAKTFELHLYHATQAKPVVFDKPGLVVMGCNIHDQMLAYLLVVDTPYFAKTDAQGVAHLTRLPQGGLSLNVWHYRLPNPNVSTKQAWGGASESTVQVRIELKPA